MFDRLRLRVRALVGRGRAERDLQDEYAYHLEQLVERNRAAGMSPHDALLAARHEFGGVEASKEESRDAWGVRIAEETLADVRMSVRALRKSPGFATVAIVSLALGVGATTAIFQLLDAVRLRSLPVASPSELYEVDIVDTSHLAGRFRSWHPSITYPLWERIRDDQRVFSGAFAYNRAPFNLSPSGEVRYGRGLYVSGDFFTTLGVRPATGRLFDRSDDTVGEGARVAVVSYAFWQSEYGGDPSVVGRPLSIDGKPFEIVGVSNKGFTGIEPGRTFDVAIPVAAEPVLAGEDSVLKRRDGWWLTVIGRLAPGVSPTAAAEQLAAISPAAFEATLPERYDAEMAGYYRSAKLQATSASGGVSQVRRDYETPLWLLLAIAGLVLVIACANLANLLLARASTQEREMAVRLALGASRTRLVRRLVTENLVLAAAGAALGLLVARYLSAGLAAMLDANGTSLFVDLSLDWRVFAFTAAIGATTCLLFGVAPAARATRTTPNAALRSGGRGSTEGRERLGFRRALVASQVALSLVLVMAALLFARTLGNLLSVDVGFDYDKIAVADIDFSRLHVPVGGRVAAKRDFVERLRRVPGVADASSVAITPLGGSGWNNMVWLDGDDASKRKVSYFNRVGTHFFKTTGIPILAGRDFDERDTAGSTPVALVNEEFAKQFAEGADPIGRQVMVGGDGPDAPPVARQIVGLVRTAKYRAVKEPSKSTIYVPAEQEDEPDQFTSVLVRSDRPNDVVPALRQALSAEGPDVTYELGLISTSVRDSLVRERLMATLSIFFGVLALVLATVGLYGVTAYSVSRRTHEIGIRMALGAMRSTIARGVLREVATTLVWGLVAGVGFALLAAKAAETLLFGVKPTDVGSLVLAGAILSGVAVIAALVPARRASSVDPMRALRDE